MKSPEMFHSSPDIVSPSRREGKLERMKSQLEKLQDMLADISSQINTEAKEAFGVENLVNTDCTMSMENFARNKEGGIYAENEIRRDKEEIEKREMEWSGADKPAVQTYFAGKGIRTKESVVKQWKDTKMKAKSAQAEMAISVLLHKILGEEFLVVRSSTYDDYVNGVDNLILNKQTGEVICAFDEVHEGGTGDRTDKKTEKIKKIALKGGAKARYGMKLTENKLVRSRMENTPVFYLSLKSEELDALLHGMNYDPHGEKSDIEVKTFQGLIESLREQRNTLESLENLSPVLKEKLQKFEHTLDTLDTFANVQVLARAA